MAAGSFSRQLKEEQARKSPVRVRILELYEENEGRSLEPDALLPRLREGFGSVSRPQLAYHLRWLRDADLIPRVDPRA
jgi:Fe2+ or Zn2+ uptake regulation protein